MKTAADLIKEAHQRIEKLCTDATVSAKHRRSMAATLKPLEKALAKLSKPMRGGSSVIPGQLDVQGVIANPSATNTDNHPLSSRNLDSLALGKNGAMPFSIQDNPNLSVNALPPNLNDQITPRMEGVGFVGGAKGKGSKRSKRSNGKRA
jgi:hypothetical protein